MDMKTAVIYRLEELIRQKDITVNEAAIRSGVPPSTLKNILYGQSKNVGVVTIKKLCDGLEMLFTYPVAGAPDKVIALLVGMVLFVVNEANRVENQVIMQMVFIDVSCQNKLILAA